MRPTTMLFRNLASMDTEESIRANPIDGVVLLTGCDKTTPSTLMGACSVNLPTIIAPGGPMLNGRFRGECIGSGSFNWLIKEKQSVENYTDQDINEVEIECGATTPGTLYDHGNCQHHGLHGRITWTYITWRCRHSCGRLPQKVMVQLRPPHC